MQAKLLIVDDDKNLRDSLQEYFKREGFDVTIAEDGVQGLRLLSEAKFDLIILDVVMPTLDGLEVCQIIRHRVGNTVGIILISAFKQEDINRAEGLNMGADVYMLKPFQTQLLLAQVERLLQRINKADNQKVDWFVTNDKCLRIHFERRKVEVNGKEIHLSRQEFDVLKYLIEHYDIPRTRSDLMEAVWKYEQGVSDAAINTCVAKLREKIKVPDHPGYIYAVHGVGYRFKSP